MASKRYDKVFKEKIARLHLEEDRTLSSLAKEYNVAKSTLNGWIKCFKEECVVSEDKISPNIYEEIKLLKSVQLNLKRRMLF